MAIAPEIFFSSIRQMGTYAWSVPTSARRPCGVTKSATARNLFDNCIPGTLIQIILQLAGTAGMTEFSQSLRLNLTDTLTGHIELFSYLFQRTGTAIVQSETQAQHLLLSLGQRAKHLLQLFFQHRKRRGICRNRNIVVLDKIAQMAVFLLADRRFQGNRLLRDLQDLADTLHGHMHFLSDLFRSRFTSKLLQQLTGNADQLVDRLYHMHRNTDGTCLV